MTMQLLRPDGTEAPVATDDIAHILDPVEQAEALPGEGPAEHKPRWFRRRAEVCNNEFVRIMNAFLSDYNQPQSPGVVRDVDAMRRAFGHEWAVFASKQMTDDSEPIKLNKKAMYEEIDRMLANAAKQERLQTPLHQLKEGLDEFEFRLIGQSKMRGEVWMCSHLVLTVSESGTVCVFTLAGHFELGLMMGNLLENVDFSPALLSKVDLSMKDIHMLLGALKVAKIAAPTEGECELARTGTLAPAK